jgi:hypothetical protein
MPQLDIQPIGGPAKLDIQPLDIQPIESNSTPAQQEEPGFFSKLWHAVGDPVTDAPSRFAHSVSDYITTPSLATSPTGQGGLGDYLAETYARGKGFVGGALQGIGDIASGFTSPLNLAITAATGGSSAALKAGLPEVASGLSLASKALAVPTMAHGAGSMFSPDSTMSERGQGLVELAGGGAAMMHTPNMPHGQIPEEIPIKQPMAPRDVMSVDAITPDLVSEGAPPIREKTGNFWVDDTHRMQDEALSRRADPVQAAAQKAKMDKWNESQRKGMINEGRFEEPNTAPIPDEQLTPEQLAIRQSAEAIRQHSDDYSQWFSEQEEKLPEDELFKPPDDVEAKYKAEREALQNSHEKLVNDYIANETSGTESSVPLGTTSTKPGTLPLPETSVASGGNLKPPSPLPGGHTEVAPGIVDKFADYRKVPVGTKYTIKPEAMTRRKMADAIKLGFDFEGIDDSGHIIIRKTKESPDVKFGNSPELEASAWQEAANLPRTLMASMDMSAPLRQGLGLIHKKAFWTALPEMVRAFGSEDAYNQIQKGITDDPIFQKTVNAEGRINQSFAEKAGLQLTSLKNMSSREESIMSSLAEKVPGVRPSNRAYTVFLNKLRADTFKQMVGDFGAYSGMDAKNNLSVARSVAEFVNTASGRGSLGAAEPAAKVLSSVLFSPRLLASRLQMMAKGGGAVFSPEVYMTKSPSIRREYLKSLAAIAATTGTFTQLMRLGSGATVEPDIASSDFGKIKFGDTRIDPYGGFQQPIVLMQRMLPTLDLSEYGLGQIGGQMKSTTTEKEYGLGDSGFGRSTRDEVLLRFIRSKTNPIINFGWGLMHGSKELSGKPMQLGYNEDKNPVQNVFENSVAQRFLPMLSQDIYDLIRDDQTSPQAKMLAGFLASVGMGSQTYGREQ